MPVDRGARRGYCTPRLTNPASEVHQWRTVGTRRLYQPPQETGTKLDDEEDGGSLGMKIFAVWGGI